MSNYSFDAVIFDLDGVITQTAQIHSRAWKEMFDDYLCERSEKYDEDFKAFTHEHDYLRYVDGKPRYEGVKSFLESRGIELPYGRPDDPPTAETYCGIGNRKNVEFNKILRRDGVEVYPSTVALIHRLKAEGIHVGVASSSKNCESVLRAAGLLDLMETRIDGVVSAQLGLKGKPEPDIFTTAADHLGVPYDRAVVVEDAISGVQAGRKGNFGLVLGVAREGNARQLAARGADIVVEDLGEIGFEGLQQWFDKGLEEDNWSLTYRDYVPAKERSREALLSVANGYFGTRGAMAESTANAINYPGTYMAGVFNRLTSVVGGREVENEDFVNVSNWLPLTFKIDDGPWLDVNKVKIVDIERRLNFRQGVMYKNMVVEDEQGRQTKIFTRRFASMASPHLAGIHYSVTALNYSAEITFKSALEGAHINAGVQRYADLQQQHLEPHTEYAEEDYQYLQVKTTQSHVFIEEAARHEVLFRGKVLLVEWSHGHNEALVESVFSQKVEQGDTLGLNKLVYLRQGLDEGSFDAARQALHGLHFEKVLEQSLASWARLWDKIDIRVQGDRLAQKMLRLHLYHVFAGTSPHNEHIDFGIPARGLTGEAYRGHIFWDELYILPLYFMHLPQVAKSVLLYRYRRLDKARKYARQQGYRGAMFPWQSGSSGREETQRYHYNPISDSWGDDHSSLQRHVSLAIAYNIISYYYYTRDLKFMESYGWEVVLEIARFWADKAQYNEQTGRYSIDGVMGPDEFHEGYPGAKKGGLKDNAYTNLMVVWLLEEVQALMPRFDKQKMDKLKEAIGLNDKEMQQWKELSRKINLVISDDGILAQFDGYFELEELDWDYYREKYGDIHRMDRVLKAEGKSPDTFKVAKQADTLMIFYNLSRERVDRLLQNLGYQLPADYVERNLEYYLKRTSHGSTLSRVVHAFLARQIGKEELAWKLYMEALTSDYNDIQGGTTAEGIHTGVMAGTVRIALASFAGLSMDGEQGSFKPRLPEHWRRLQLKATIGDVSWDIDVS